MDHKIAKNALLISFAAETFFAGYGLLLGTETSFASIVYFVAGLALVFFLLWLPEVRIAMRMKQESGSIWIKCGLAAVMLFLACITSRYWFDRIPIDPDYADMLPVIKVMNERFLAGHWRQVYDPIAEIWNGTRPIYLPAMWLPYSGALWLKLDMRWVTVFAVLLSFGCFLFILRIRKKSFSFYVLVAIAGMLFWWLFSRDDVHGLFSLSEEGPVILYYSLLCFAIVSENGFLIAVAASLCLLSRYSGIGWIIPHLLFLIYRRDFKKLIVFSITGISMFLVFILFPFGSEPVKQLIHLPESYVYFASRVWKDTPEVFWLNLGFAKFFGPQHIAALHTTLLLASFGIPILFMLICLLQKKWRLNNINLATLKLSLVVFYQFIDVPYGYLFYTSSFVSLMIMGIVFSNDQPSSASLQRPMPASSKA